MDRYVFLVNFSLRSSDVFFLAARCHHVLHGFQRHHNIRSIGVTYPHWTVISVGDCIAFISHDQEKLRLFSCQPLFVQMARINKFECSSILLLDQYGQEGRFTRTQRPGKYTEAWLIKDQRRREKREIQPRKYSPEDRVFEHYHSVDMRRVIQKADHSGDAGKKKMKYLYIHRSMTEGIIKGTFNSYGLSSDVNTGTVPLVLD